MTNCKERRGHSDQGDKDRLQRERRGHSDQWDND